MPYTPLELAAAFIKTGELDDALDALNQHLAATPSDDEARRMRIETLLRMPENYQLALTDCDALSTPTADDCLKRSILCEKLNNLDSALQSMDTALQLQPGTERLIERQLYLLQLKGDFAAALKLLDVVPSTWRWKQWAGDL
ncbi:MAG TPA: hypothetical protein VHL11_25405, partial [Phototrophicaceae bacterium]|nr:hypothetical protein [Phototrophicaceae bacterium]